MENDSFFPRGDDTVDVLQYAVVDHFEKEDFGLGIDGLFCHSLLLFVVDPTLATFVVLPRELFQLQHNYVGRCSLYNIFS